MSRELDLREKARTHGDFVAKSSLVDHLDEVLRRQAGYANLTAVQRQSISGIIGKLASIITGDPDYPDHWNDIKGYAVLAEDNCHYVDPRQNGFEFAQPHVASVTITPAHPQYDSVRAMLAGSDKITTPNGFTVTKPKRGPLPSELDPNDGA